MNFITTLSTEEDTNDALAQVCDEIRLQLAGEANLALVFLSPHHAGQIERIASTVCETARTENVLGCTGESIVGGDREIEGQPALAVWVAQMPRVSVRAFHLSFESKPDGGLFTGWPTEGEHEGIAGSTMLLLGEPFSFPADVLVAGFNEHEPVVPVIGGMASGGWGPGQNKLILGREVHDEGAVAAIINGPVRIRTVVSQGCRPVG